MGLQTSLGNITIRPAELLGVRKNPMAGGFGANQLMQKRHLEAVFAWRKGLWFFFSQGLVMAYIHGISIWEIYRKMMGNLWPDPKDVGFHSGGSAIAGWFRMEKSIYKWMITRGTPMTQETSIWENDQILDQKNKDGTHVWTNLEYVYR